MLHGVDLLFLWKVQNGLLLCLKFWNLLSLFLFSHFLVLLQKSDLFVKSLKLPIILLHQSFNGLNVLHPFTEDLLSELNWISCTNQAPTQKFISVFLYHFLEIDVISLLNLFFFFTLLLFFHEIKAIVRFIGLFFNFIVDVVFFLGKFTYVFDEFVALFWKNGQNSFCGTDDVFLTNLRNVVNIRKALETNFIAFSEQMEQWRSSVQSHQERISLKKIHDYEQLCFVLDASVWENDFTLETAILTSNLKLSRINWNHI